MDREYIAGNAASLDRLKTFISTLSTEDMQRPMSDGWTVAAYFGHLAFWDRRTSRLIDKWKVEGYSEHPYEPHSINDAMKPSLLLVPPQDAANEVIAAAEEADQAVASVSDELMAAIAGGKSVGLRRSNHRNMHLVEFEALFA